MAKQLQSAREKAYTRQRGLCFYCKRAVSRGEATVDHRVPRSAGGNLRNGNGVMACRECNQQKRNMPEEVFRHGPAAREEWSEGRAEMWRRANALLRDSRSKPEGRRQLVGSVHESGGARSAIAQIPLVTTKPLPPSNPDVWPENEWKRICRIWRGEEE